jgi:hypothetical protein
MVQALSEQLALVGYISTSAGFTGASKQTATIDMDIFRRALIILQGHVATTLATTHGGLTLSIWDAGATGTNPSTAIITCTGLQLSKTTRGYQTIAEVRSEQLNTVVSSAATYGRFFQARVKNGTLKAIANVIVLGDTARYGPASDYDLASVAEIKTS